jgi:hypothetical protein
MLRVAMQQANPEDEVVVETSGLQALEVAQRWGALRYPVTVKVHPSHAALEEAAHQQNVPWMRGWARFDEIELETPSGWGGDRVPQNVTELLSHELTHVVMYQHISEPDAWTRVAIPLWFREGMASVTSHQGYRRMTGKQLGEWLRAHPGEDPWLGAEVLAHTAQPVVYGAAHRAFERLLDLHGDAGIQVMLDALRNNDAFDVAFARAAGMPPQAFLAQLRGELVGPSAQSAPAGVPAAPEPGSADGVDAALW